jgi:catechol 2,3-dioxygenase-like lactoylglutathione lyase family enzyme
MESKTIKTLKAHLALNVKDVERSIGFYRRMLGIEPSKVREGYAKFDVRQPPLNLTLNQNDSEGRGALSHLGIQVASTADVLALRERWRGAGLDTFDEMGTNCCYAVQDKTWVTDPDGNSWEAFVVLEDNLAESPACCVTREPEGSGAQASSACSTETEASCSTETAASSTGTAATVEAGGTGAAASSCCGTNAAQAPLKIAR